MILIKVKNYMPNYQVISLLGFQSSDRTMQSIVGYTVIFLFVTVTPKYKKLLITAKREPETMSKVNDQQRKRYNSPHSDWIDQKIFRTATFPSEQQKIFKMYGFPFVMNQSCRNLMISVHQASEMRISSYSRC